MKSNILKEYYQAMERHDWDAKRAMMCDDLKFRGPMMSADNADEMIAAVKEMNCDVKFEDIEMFEQGETVMSFFTLKMGAPMDGTFRMAERAQFEGDKIKSSELIYDARAFPGS